MHNDAAAVAETVRPYLEKHTLDDIRFHLVEGRIQKVDGWWRVPIRPSRWPERMFPVYEVLAEIEEDLRDHEQVDILLSLGAPADAETAATLPA